METLQAHRTFFAELVTAIAGAPKSRLTSAFAVTPRERYLGPGPWKVFTGRGYTETPTGDPTFLYQDVVVALDEERKINNGQPALHALCLVALNVKERETVVHIGAGTGYYTAVLAELTGTSGKVFAYEISPGLAQRATRNLADLPNVTVFQRSGAEGLLPACDAIYVSAGATAPLDIWLDALRPTGRLLFPLTPDGPGEMPGVGGMLLVTRVREERFDARFIAPVMFTPCVGARDSETGKNLAEAFRRGDSAKVRSLRRERNRPMKAAGAPGTAGGSRLPRSKRARQCNLIALYCRLMVTPEDRQSGQLRALIYTSTGALFDIVCAASSEDSYGAGMFILGLKRRRLYDPDWVKCVRST